MEEQENMTTELETATDQQAESGISTNDMMDRQTYEEPSQQAQQQSDADRNFAELREQKKRLERERDDLRRRMEQIEASQKKQSAPAQPSLADDDLVEWKYVKQEIDGLKSEIQKYQSASYATNAEARLKAKYQDFDKVVTQSNIERLKEEYPEIATTLSANQDLYTQASAAYDIIKRYGIYQETTYDKDKERVQQNASKPRAMNTSAGQRGESPLDNASAFASGMTPELKKQLWKEMQDAIKRR